MPKRLEIHWKHDHQCSRAGEIVVQRPPKGFEMSNIVTPVCAESGEPMARLKVRRY
jgi:hypothetical protein